MKIIKVYVLLLLVGLIFSCSNDEEGVSETGVANFSISELREVEGATISLGINIGIDSYEHAGGTITIAIEGGQYGTDFTTSKESANFDVTIEPGVLFTSFSIQPVDDELIESDKQLVIKMTSAIGSLQVGDNNSITFTIIDDDDPTVAMISFANETQEIQENAGEATEIAIAFDKASTNGGSITIESSGDAVLGTDYSIDGFDNEIFIITVPAGASGAAFNIHPIDNAVFAEDKNIVFTITGVEGGLETVNPASTSVSIINDDEPVVPAVDFAMSNVSEVQEDGGDVALTLHFSSPVSGEATFTVDLGNNTTATLGEDFTINGSTDIPATITVMDGATSATLNLNILNDDVLEETDEIIHLAITAVTGDIIIGIESPEITLTLIDDEEPELPFEYLETFESSDGSDTFLVDFLGWQPLILPAQTIPDRSINLIANSGSFSDPADPTGTSDFGLNLFYNAQTDPNGNGEMDNVVITPLLEGSGAIDMTVDVAYAFKNQNSGMVSFYWSDTYNGDGNWNDADWNLIDVETVPDMDGEGFGNNAYKRESYSFSPSSDFYIAMRVTQSVTDDNYRMRWRFDNLNLKSK